MKRLTIAFFDRPSARQVVSLRPFLAFHASKARRWSSKIS
jgi:hypothetical protein